MCFGREYTDSSCLTNLLQVESHFDSFYFFSCHINLTEFLDKTIGENLFATLSILFDVDFFSNWQTTEDGLNMFDYLETLYYMSHQIYHINISNLTTLNNYELISTAAYEVWLKSKSSRFQATHLQPLLTYAINIIHLSNCYYKKNIYLQGLQINILSET